jgi:serine/threonine protein kinase
LNRFRCELNGYRNLHSFGVCERGFVPYYYGYIDRLDPTKFRPRLTHFANDLHDPRGILLEYLQETEELNCVNYSDCRFQITIHGLREIHGALIQHRDIYPKNILIAREESFG